MITVSVALVAGLDGSIELAASLESNLAFVGGFDADINLVSTLDRST